MKHLLAIVALMVAHSAMAGWYTGAQLNALAESYTKTMESKEGMPILSYTEMGLFSGYVTGYTDGNSLLCIPAGVTRGQLLAIVAKYLKNNPEIWNLPSEVLIFNSLIHTFPCKK